jgi:lipoprotein-anchoring transpeptidase ErfK/SrfK
MRVQPFFLTGASSLALAWASASCGIGTLSTTPHRRPERTLYKWYDDGGEGKVAIRISLTDQIAEFKRGGRDIGWCYVATGKEGHDTRPGSYSITEKIEDKHSNIYGWMEDEAGNVTDGDAKAGEKVPKGMVYVPAPMPYWMRLTSYGVGMHGGLIPEPGEPASHGCIRMPKEFVATVFDAVNVGTPVTITNSPSEKGKTEVNSHLPQKSWSTYSGTQSAESVTYRNGQPVSYY